jgi:hypothetical protein
MCVLLYGYQNLLPPKNKKAADWDTIPNRCHQQNDSQAPRNPDFWIEKQTNAANNTNTLAFTECKNPIKISLCQQR